MGGHPRIGGVEVEIQRVLRGIEVQDCKDEGLVRWLAMGGLAMSVRAGAWGGGRWWWWWWASLDGVCGTQLGGA